MLSIFAICLMINQFRLGQICSTFCMFPATDILISVYIHAFTYICPNLIWVSANLCSQKMPLRSVMKPFRFLTDTPSGERFVWYIRVDWYSVEKPGVSKSYNSHRSPFNFIQTSHIQSIWSIYLIPTGSVPYVYDFDTCQFQILI